jgi:hypothetical protein
MIPPPITAISAFSRNGGGGGGTEGRAAASHRPPLSPFFGARTHRRSSVGCRGGRLVKGCSCSGGHAAHPADGGGDLAQALLALAGAGAEPGVALDLLQIGEASLDGPLDVRQRDVLAPAENDLAAHGPAQRALGSLNSVEAIF